MDQQGTDKLFAEYLGVGGGDEDISDMNLIEQRGGNGNDSMLSGLNCQDENSMRVMLDSVMQGADTNNQNPISLDLLHRHTQNLNLMIRDLLGNKAPVQQSLELSQISNMSRAPSQILQDQDIIYQPISVAELDRLRGPAEDEIMDDENDPDEMKELMGRLSTELP